MQKCGFGKEKSVRAFDYSQQEVDTWNFSKQKETSVDKFVPVHDLSNNQKYGWISNSINAIN